MFRPTQINNLRTPATLLIPECSRYNGVTKKTCPESGPLIYVNTAEIVTWFRSDIKSDCRIKIDSDLYDIKGDPEDVELQHQIMILKVEKVSGGA